MGYDIYVARSKDQPILTMTDWLAAVASAPDARIMTTDWDLGRGLTEPHNPGDVELHFKLNKKRKWVPVFRVFETKSGRASIRTRVTAIGKPEVLAFLRHVTAALNAKVIGDEGEEYDLVTGDPVDLDPKYRR